MFTQLPQNGELAPPPDSLQFQCASASQAPVHPKQKVWQAHMSQHVGGIFPGIIPSAWLEVFICGQCHQLFSESHTSSHNSIRRWLLPLLAGM